MSTAAELLVQPDLRGPLVDGREAHFVTLRMGCTDVLGGRPILQYEAVPAEEIATCARVLLGTHQFQRPACPCCAALVQRYGVLP